MNIFSIVEFETPQSGAGLESLQETMDSLIRNIFAVPEPKFEFLKSIVVD